MLYSHSQPDADIRVLTIGRKIMSIKKSQMRADLKALDKADKSISSILEKYIPFFEKDNKMKDIKTDMQEVQVGMLLEEPNYKAKLGVYSIDDNKLNAEVIFNKAENIPEYTSANKIYFSKKFISDDKVMRKIKKSTNKKLYDKLAELKSEFSDAKSNRWTTFISKVRHALEIKNAVAQASGKPVVERNKHSELSVHESFFHQLFGIDVINKDKPVNKNSMIARISKTPDMNPEKWVKHMYPAFISYLEDEEINPAQLTEKNIAKFEK